jgi:hypothetical protein
LGRRWRAFTPRRAGCENLFILVPLAAGLDDSADAREKCYDMVLPTTASQYAASRRKDF